LSQTVEIRTIPEKLPLNTMEQYQRAKGFHTAAILASSKENERQNTTLRCTPSPKCEALL